MDYRIFGIRVQKDSIPEEVERTENRLAFAAAANPAQDSIWIDFIRR